MTTYTWKTGVSGNWKTATDWTPAGPPNGSAADVLINAGSAYTVSISNGESFSANQVTLDAAGATLSVASSGTLTLAGADAALGLQAGTFILDGLLQGGTVDADGAAVLPDGTLDGVTWLGPLVFGPMEILTVVGGLTVKTETGSSAGTIDVSANNDQLVLNSSETLDNAVLNFSGNGDYLVDATSGGTLTLGSGLTLESSGINDVLFNDEANDATSSTVINAGLINVSAGTLTETNGNLVNTGTIAVTGGGTLEPTGITNSGSIIIDAGGTLATGDITANTGQITVASGGLLSVGVFDADSGGLAVAAGGTFSAIYFDSSVSFTNYGLVEADGHFAADGITVASGATMVGAETVIGGVTAISTVTVIGTVIDTGIVEANSGVLLLESAVSGTGVLKIDAGAGLQLDGSDSTDVDFTAVGGTLILGQAGGFSGTIDGFTAGDTIDLPNVVYDPSGTATMSAGNTLQVVANASTYDLTFDPTQSFTGEYFHLTPDGTAIIENTVPPYYVWTTALSGDWGAGADWTPAGPPDAATADAVIDATGSYTVSISSSESFLANALTLTAAGATLSVAGTLTLNQIISDGLIDIIGGTVDLSQGALNNAGVISIGSNGAVGGELMLNAIANGGGITLAAGGTLNLQGAQTLSGDTVAGLGGVTSTGGLLLVGGSLDLGGGTLDLAATGLLSEFGVAGTLANGTVDANAGAVLLQNGAVLNDVTWTGTLTIYGDEGVGGLTGANGLNVVSGSLTNNGNVIGGTGIGGEYASAGGNGINILSGSLTNNGVVTGGTGFYAYYGGSGGNGVTAIDSSLTNNDAVFGGDGGNAGTSFGGGQGGTGGDGVVLTSSMLTNNAGIIGGQAGFISTMGGPEFATGGEGVVAISSTLINDGQIAGGAGATGGDGVYGSGATLTNNAAITSGGAAGAFYGNSGVGVDINSSRLTNDGTIIGGWTGVSGTGDSVTNNGVIAGSVAGVDITNSVLANTGLIFGGGAGAYGIAGDGVDISNTVLTNSGTIIGGSDTAQHGTAATGVVFTGGGTLRDSGSISGGSYAGGVSDAVNFGTGTSLLILEPGASFDGAVVTEGTVTTLELADPVATGTITDIGSFYVGFGTITVDPQATWVAEGSVTGSGTFDLGADSRLIFDGGVDATSPVDFAAASGRLGLGDPAGFAATVYGFQPGDAIDFTEIASTGSITAGVNGSNDLTLTSNGTLLAEIKLDPAQDFSADAFHTAPDGGTGTVVTDTPICFLPGTMIRTPAGETPIERLAVGDFVMTARRAVRPIVWIGTGRVLAMRGRRSAATPVILRKGALADNVPCRDLRVTKAHAVEVDGVLIPVEFLVNHRSILWDDQAQEVLLYHIELETHDVLLANGAPAESYRDDGNRWLFHNANSGWDRPPQPPCAPVLTGGPVVDAAWLRLLQRSGSRHALPLTDDPDLHLRVDGRRVDAASRRGESQVFALAGPPESVRIVSLSAMPQELGLARDPRCLGVALRQIMLRQGIRVRTIAAADAALAEGFHGFEPDNAIRWTNGDAAIAATLFEGFTGPLELLLRLGGTTRYLVASEARAA